jgi:hypothetical protein
LRLRPARLEERQLALLWGVAAVGSILLRPLWVALAPALPRCPLRTLTGIPCPTCGTTRAALALLDGRVTAALASNPLSTLAGVAFVVGGVAAPIWCLLRLPMVELEPGHGRLVAVALALALLANWIWVIGASS